MADELERILSVDEECRSRVAFAQKQIDRAIEDARRERARAAEEQERAAAEALEKQLAAIRAEGDARIAERRLALDDYLKRLAVAGEKRIEEAAEVYAGIVRGDAEGADR